jgi:succinyl-CoA synthetase alpha subunit
VSILIDDKTRVLAQGIKGRRSMLAIKSSIDYGTRIVAGVTFGMGGKLIDDVPIYNTVHGAVKHHQIDASVIFAQGAQVKQEVLEACSAGIKLIVVLEEHVPYHDRLEMLAVCRKYGCTLIGPNSNGIISVGQSKIGTIGGAEPDRIFAKGSVGLISRSVGMASEIGYLLKKHHIGISTCVTMGSEAIVGTRMKDLLRMFLEDDATDIVLLSGIEGSLEEDDTAEYLKSGTVQKPVIAFLSGHSMDQLPISRFSSCQACESHIGTSSVTVKSKLLREAGVVVIEKFQELPNVISKFMKKPIPLRTDIYPGAENVARIGYIETYFEKSGFGKTLVLVHCLGLHSGMWHNVEEDLRFGGYSIVKYDLRGHGKTSSAGEDWTLELMAEDLKGLLDDLRVPYCHVVGLSIGGMIAQTFALRYPERVEKLVLSNTTSGQTAESRNALLERARTVESGGMQTVLESTINHWFTSDFPEHSPHVVEFVRQELSKCSPQSFAKATRAIAGLDLWDRLGEIAVPTLVMTGENDPGTNVETARRIHELIPGSRLEIIPDASHMAPIEQPDAYARAIIQFLDSERG